MPDPVFEYVPVVADPGKCSISVVHVQGLSTSHADRKSDRGRLHGRLTSSGGSYTLSLFSTFARQSADEVLRGTTASISSYFDLTAQNASGMSGRAFIGAYSADTDSIVMLVSFATDHDVLTDSGRCSHMPGYDHKFGLAHFHAQAMRQILAADLPRAVPHLFNGVGLAGIVPTAYTAAAIPDLSNIANADQLRVAQASLVKALSAEQSEHIEEMATIARLARERYAQAMKALAEANLADERAQDAYEADRQVSVGSWSRG